MGLILVNPHDLPWWMHQADPGLSSWWILVSKGWMMLVGPLVDPCEGVFWITVMNHGNPIGVSRWIPGVDPGGSTWWIPVDQFV